MRAIVLADLHVHPFKLCSRDGGKDRLQDGLSALKQSLEYAREYQCPWIFCGDFKQPKLIWPQEALTGSLAILRAYPDVGKIMLPGQHDGDMYHLGGSGLAPFYEVAKVVEEPTIIQNSSFGPIGVAPARPSITPEFLEQAERAQARILFGHAFLSGVLLGPDEVRLPDKGLRRQDLGLGEVFHVAALGDIHKGQGWLGPQGWRPWKDLVPGETGGKKRKTSRKGRTSSLDPGRPPSGGNSGVPLRGKAPWKGEVLYPGSPYGQSWGESEDGAKGVLLVDFESGEVSLLPIQAPRYLRVSVDSLDAMDQLDPSFWEGHFVRLLVGPWAEGTRGRGRLESLREQAKARVFQVIPQRAPVEVRRASLHAGLPRGDLLGEYLKARPFEGETRPAMILEAGRRLLEGRDAGD